MSQNLEIDAVGFTPKSTSSQNTATVVPVGPPPLSTHYNMKHPKRGQAIIFNHMNFKMHHCPPRLGTNKDRDDLKKLFERFNFNVRCYEDLAKEEIRKVLISVAEDDHTEEDCLVVVVLSHGEKRRIFAKDAEYPTDMLWMYFDGNHSPTLIGKPKLFFIQACQGGEVDKGVQLKSRTEVDSFVKRDNFYSIPVMADILIMFSTVEDYLSWRNPRTGSYFIQSLIRQLSAYGDVKDILSILTYVNREVAIGSSPEMDVNDVPNYPRKQMCCIVSMLTREMYLR